VSNTRQAVGLLRRTHSRGLTRFISAEVVIHADQREIPVGIDGEAITMPTPVRCSTRPRALRVRVPKHRPGVPPAKPALDWVRLKGLALGRGARAVEAGRSTNPAINRAGSAQ
jgi:hypothetical protein